MIRSRLLVFELLEDSLQSRKLLSTKHISRKITSLSPKTFITQYRSRSYFHHPSVTVSHLVDNSIGHTAGDLAHQVAYYHSDVPKRRNPSLIRSHKIRRKALSMAKISDERKEKKDAGPSINYIVWALRLAHENSYLSWSRNAAICAGIAATVRIIDSQGQPLHSSVSSDSIVTGFADLGLVFILYGSCHHIYQAYLLRKTLHLRSIEFFWVCAYTAAIGLLYCFLIQTKFGIVTD